MLCLLTRASIPEIIGRRQGCFDYVLHYLSKEISGYVPGNGDQSLMKRRVRLSAPSPTDNRYTGRQATEDQGPLSFVNTLRNTSAPVDWVHRCRFMLEAVITHRFQVTDGPAGFGYNVTVPGAGNYQRIIGNRSATGQELSHTNEFRKPLRRAFLANSDHLLPVPGEHIRTGIVSKIHEIHEHVAIRIRRTVDRCGKPGNDNYSTVAWECHPHFIVAAILIAPRYVLTRASVPPRAWPYAPC